MMKRSSKTARSNSARGFSGLLRRRRITRPQRDQTGLSRGEFFQTLEGRTLLSAIPAGWEAKPVAVPHFLQTATQRASHRHAHANASTASTDYAGSSTAYGLTPAQVRGAYGVSGISFNGVSGDASGQTIAIVDAFDDPTAASG